MKIDDKILRNLNKINSSEITEIENEIITVYFSTMISAVLLE